MSLGRLCSGEWRIAGAVVLLMVSIGDAMRCEDQVRSVRREYAAILLLDLEWSASVLHAASKKLLAHIVRGGCRGGSA